jgi:deoxyribonuclease-4
MTGPQLGAHMSIAGGTPRALDRAEATGCEALQIFTKNSNQWRGRPLGESEVEAFRDRAAGGPVGPIAAHASYLINLAAPDPALRKRSVAALADELQRGDQLGLAGVVLHPGAYTTGTEADGIQRIADGIAEAQAAQAGDTRLLLEHTAGQGTMLGHRFEQLRAMIDQMDDASRVAICLDTCHLLAAGYDIVSEAGYARVFEEFDAILGLDRLVVFHLNDSKKPLGSRVDRHAGIGQGCVGREPFRRLVRDERFRHLPMVLETPKAGGLPAGHLGPDPLDLENLAILKRFRDGEAPCDGQAA